MLSDEISEEIIQNFYEIFGDEDSSHVGRDTIPKFLMISESGKTHSDFNDEMKYKAIKIVCPNVVNESDLLHLRISKSLNEGWEFTRFGFHIKTLEHSLYTSYDDFNLSIRPNIDLNREDILFVALINPSILAINNTRMYKVNAYGIIYNENKENDGLLLFDKILGYDNVIVQKNLDKFLESVRQILINHSLSQ